MIRLFEFAAVAAVAFYLGGKYSVAAVKAELVKLETSAVADVKAVIAAVRAKL